MNHLKELALAVVGVGALGYGYERFIKKSVGPAPAPSSPANPTPGPAPSTSPVVALLTSVQSALPTSLGGGVVDQVASDGEDILSGGMIGQDISGTVDLSA